MERFWSKVAVLGSDDCWEWQAGTCGGYGSFGFKGRVRRAHVVSWILESGVDPYPACVLHRCDNRKCVNPGHLFLGTRGDNNRDRAAKGRTVAPTDEANGNGKLTAEQKSHICCLVVDFGLSRADAARQFGITGPRVSQIVKASTVPAVRFNIVSTPDDVSEHTPPGYEPRLAGKYEQRA